MHLQEMVAMVLYVYIYIYIYGLCAIDNFTKTVGVIPISNIKPSEVISALKLIYGQLGNPKQLYSDEDSNLRSQEFFRFVNENNIKTIQTLTHAHTIGRFIYIFRVKLYRRLDGLNQDKHEWVKQFKNIVGKYSNTVHYTIEIKPDEAIIPSNHLWAAWHLQHASNKNKPYEDKKGDMVRTMIKQQV